MIPQMKTIITENIDAVADVFQAASALLEDLRRTRAEARRLRADLAAMHRRNVEDRGTIWGMGVPRLRPRRRPRPRGPNPATVRVLRADARPQT
jgi:hypothetical protein